MRFEGIILHNCMFISLE
ncbi:hypothetical protein [Clostridioides difficile]